MSGRNFCVFEASQVAWAGLMRFPPHFGGRKNRPSVAQRLGIRYERRAQEYLLELFPDTYVPSPWVAFRLNGEPMLRFCQPDGIVIDIPSGRVLLIEIKLRHTPEAYTQITGIYEPVLTKLFPGWEIRHVEMTRWYDPHTYFPVPVQLVSDLTLVPRGRFGVHIWRA